MFQMFLFNPPGVYNCIKNISPTSRYLDVLFNGILLVSGMIMLCISDVLQQPFLNASASSMIIFSVALGWQIFKVLQNVCDADKTSQHFRITNVLRLIAIFLYASTLVYRQNAILAIMGLVLESHTMFFKMDKLCRILKICETRNLYFTSSLVTSLSAVFFRAVFPLITLIVTSRFHLNEILFMDYLPLAIFFLSIVFYTAANIWLIKVSFEGTHRSYLNRLRLKKSRLLCCTFTPNIPNYIHNDLWTGKGQACLVNMSENPQFFSQDV